MADRQDIDVLHLIGTLSPGGAERNLYYLAPQMAKSAFRYGICCLTRRGDLAGEIEHLGIPVWEMGFRQRYTFSTIWRLSRLLKQKQVKVLHTHLYNPGFVGRLAGLMAGTPVMITHEHGKTLWKKWYHRWFERLALRITDLRIAVSNDILNLRLQHEHTPPSKIRLVYNAVDPTTFSVPENVRADTRKELGLDQCFVIGSVGRLVEEKCFDLALEIARDVCAKLPEARLVIVGAGLLNKQLRGLADSRGLAGKVLFTGHRSDIPALMAAMDLYLITSKREGLPLTLIEAMMSSKPIVSTSVGGVLDAITHNEDGILTEIGDKAGIVEAILSLADDTGERQRLGANARKKAVQRYSPSRVLGELESIYREFLPAS